MDFLIIFAIGAASVGLSLAANHQRMKGRRNEWRALGESLGLREGPLSLAGLRWLEGTIDGMEVLIGTVARGDPKNQSTKVWSVVRVRCPVALPAGLGMWPEDFSDSVVKLLGAQDIEVGHAFIDMRLRIVGAHTDEVVALFQHPDMNRATLCLSREGARGRVELGWVILETPGVALPILRDRLDEALTLARTLASARRAPWRALAELHDLTVSEKGTTLVLDGATEGRVITIKVGADQGVSRSGANLRVRLAQPLPKGLRITRRTGDEPAASLALGDPVVEQLLHVQGRQDQRDWVQTLLADDDMRARVIEAVHGPLGARIQGNAIYVPLDEVGPVSLDHQVGATLELARALDARAQRTASTSSEPASR